jgi:hypothetical protein
VQQQCISLRDYFLPCTSSIYLLRCIAHNLE